MERIASVPICNAAPRKHIAGFLRHDITGFQRREMVRNVRRSTLGAPTWLRPMPTAFVIPADSTLFAPLFSSCDAVSIEAVERGDRCRPDSCRNAPGSIDSSDLAGD